MISAPPQIPSYAQGFAPRDGPPANLNLWTGLQGLWVPALGPTGVTLFDQSPFKRDGTLTNMDPATAWVATEMAWACELAAAGNQYLSAPVETTYPFTLVLSAETSIYPDDRALFGLFDPGVNAWRLFTRGVNSFRLQTWDDGGVANAEFACTTVGYVQFALVGASSTDVRLYINTAEVVSYAPGRTPTVNQLRIGYNIQDQALECSVLQYALYNRALSVSEIQELYARPYALSRLRQRVYPAAGAASGLSIPIAMHHYMQMMGAA